MARELRVLLFGTYDATRNPRLDIVAEGLVRSGFVVARCLSPLAVSAEARLDVFRRPWTIGVVLGGMLATWWRLLAKTRRMSRPDVVIVGYLAHADVVLARLRFPRALIVMDHLAPLADIARDRAVGQRAYISALSALDRLAERMADVIAVDTEEHRARLAAAARAKAVVVPVGALESAFRVDPPYARSDEAPLKVIFFGHYIPLQGAVVIGRAIREVGQAAGDRVRFTMVGAGQDLAEARATTGETATVTWIDENIPRARLRRLIDEHDVALGIFGTTEKAGRVVPTKVYESAAAGLAIVTSDTPPQRRALGDAALLVPAGDAHALSGALLELATEPNLVADLRERAAAVAARDFTPVAVVGSLVQRLQGAHR